MELQVERSFFLLVAFCNVLGCIGTILFVWPSLCFLSPEEKRGVREDELFKLSQASNITDRTRREAADYEAKLAILYGRSMNMSKLQEDLDAIRKENELLEQRLHQQ